MATSPSSSDSSLSRGRTTSPNQPRRPRRHSPTPFFVAIEMAPAKPPKPLIKLDKTRKDKGKEKEKPPLTRSATSPIPALTVPSSPSVPRRPSVGSFLNLRRRETPLSAAPSPVPPGTENPSTTATVLDIHARHTYTPTLLTPWSEYESPPALNPSGPAIGFHLPRPPPSAQIPISPISPPVSPASTQGPHIHPLDDDTLSVDSIAEAFPHAHAVPKHRAGPGSKAARLLGSDAAGFRHASPYGYAYPDSRPDSPLTSGSVSTRSSSSASASAASGLLFSSDHDAYRPGDGWYADNEHWRAGPAARESMLISPIEFPSRPPSFARPPGGGTADARTLGRGFPTGSGSGPSSSSSSVRADDADSVCLGSICVSDPEDDAADDQEETPLTPVATAAVGPGPVSSRRALPLPLPLLSPVVIPTSLPPPPRPRPQWQREREREVSSPTLSLPAPAQAQAQTLIPPRIDTHHPHPHLRVPTPASVRSSLAGAGVTRPDTPFMDSILAANSPPPPPAQAQSPSQTQSQVQAQQLQLQAQLQPQGQPQAHKRDLSVVRAERAWEGRWNQGDMHDVISKLRTLK
ncbi:hypothetical protein MKEN_00279900 [Mycena kentingensis (nom. inval.)]|nr:hypothetical protein MKEN_00279900 [Mycena kentingensis (nom. inval.)]